MNQELLVKAAAEYAKAALEEKETTERRDKLREELDKMNKTLSDLVTAKKNAEVMLRKAATGE